MYTLTLQMQFCALISSLFEFITDLAKIFLSKKRMERRNVFHTSKTRAGPHQCVDDTQVAATPEAHPHDFLLICGLEPTNQTAGERPFSDKSTSRGTKTKRARFLKHFLLTKMKQTHHSESSARRHFQHYFSSLGFIVIISVKSSELHFVQ